MAIPKYQIIENDLVHMIENGTFEPGDRIFSEAELSKRYNVSSITAVRALRDLVNKGYLVREQGRGTFVSRARKHQLVKLNDIERFAGSVEEETAEVIEFGTDDELQVREILQLADDETYHRIVRVRRIGDAPYIYTISHIPSRYIKDDVLPSYYRSVYRRFREDFGIQLFDERYTETDEVVFPTPAPVAHHLKMDVDEPCVLQRKTTILGNGQAAEYTVTYKKWNYFKIEFSTAERD